MAVVATSFCRQVALAILPFLGACHRCAKMAMAFSTASNLHGKFDTGINVIDARDIPDLPFDLENVLGVHRLKIA